MHGGIICPAFTLIGFSNVFRCKTALNVVDIFLLQFKHVCFSFYLHV